MKYTRSDFRNLTQRKKAEAYKKRKRFIDCVLLEAIKISAGLPDSDFLEADDFDIELDVTFIEHEK